MRTLLATILLILLVACSQEIRPLKPFRPIPATPQSIVINDEAIEVGFSQIAGAPDAYLNQLVRVQGAYVPLTVVKCPNQKGPVLHWAMVAEELQMNAYGFERIVPLVDEGQQLIVEGVWRRHAGPAGCGKEPQTELIYYLDIKQILQPNPIMRVADAAETNTNTVIPQPVQGGAQDAPPPGGSSEVSVDAIVATPETANSITQPNYPVPTLDNSAGILVPSPTRDLSPPTPTPSITSTSPPSTSGTQPTSAPSATETPEPTEEPPTPAPTRTSPPTSVPRATVTPLPGTTSVPPTPTEEATSQGSATVTATPTTTATPLADGSATPTSEATVDAEATETLTPTLTPTGPTSTPDPEATETPTPTPSLSPNAATLDAATAQPTADATLSPTDTPTPLPYPLEPEPEPEPTPGDTPVPTPYP